MHTRLFLALQLLMALAISSTAASVSLMETIGGEKPIQLKSVAISSDIGGGMAKTSVEMVFFNPNTRRLEGNLQFPLLDGQQILGFALDVGGKMRPAVPVEKEKGRKIFEEIQRRHADPALLEKTQGNNFKLRVYPIEAMGTRKVKIIYAQALQRAGGQYSYTLPLAYADGLKDFKLSLNVHGSNHPPKAVGTFKNVKFTKSGSAYQTLITKSMFTQTGALTLSLPVAQGVQSYIQEHEGTAYFVSEVPVPIKHTARELPKVIGLLWDSSGSARARSIESELLVLDRYFKAVGNAEVRLTRLRDHSEVTQSFKILNGNWAQLRESLKKTVYDGASALCDWKPQADVEEYLLVSDGLSNYGNNIFPVLGEKQKLYAMNSSAIADTVRLEALAQRSGGRLIQVNPQNTNAAIEVLLKNTPKIDVLHAAGVTDVLVDTAQLDQGFIRVMGKLSASSTLSVVTDARESDITFAVTSNSPSHPLAAYVWANKKLQTLEANYEANRGEIRRVGGDFGIPTKETSLIVLDSIEDYVRYDVAPPRDFQEQFNTLKSRRNINIKLKRVSHLESVLEQFKQKITWWEKAYPKDTPPVPKYDQISAVATGSSDSNIMDGIVNYRIAPAVMAIPPQPRTANMSERRASRPEPSSEQPSPAQIGMTLKKWISDAPYIARMNEATTDTIYNIYLDEKPNYENSSAFFLDASDMLMEKGQRDLALRVLSNLAEMDLENRHVLRILGYRLLGLDAPEMAIPMFEKVVHLGGEEPQSYRDLGLAHAAAGHYQEAVNNLNEVVEHPWEDRFAEVELIALAEMNAIIASASHQNRSVNVSRIDPRFLKNMPLDVRAVLTWDADNSDMDLWVTDPNEEKCYYGYRATYQGGRMSRDFIGGYGPEEFSLRNAKFGKYRVEANFYGNRQQSVAGATTLQLKLTTHFGTPAAKDQMITLRLKEQSDTVFVGEFEVK